jgi:hypothetical protein
MEQIWLDMNQEKYKKAERLFNKSLNHSQYNTSARVREMAERWFNEMLKLENEKENG